MNDNLYRVWEISHGSEIPVNVIPCDFKTARATMRLRSLEVCKRLGWKMKSQGLDFAIYSIPQGKEYELRIRAETPEYLAFEALAGITYTVDEGLEYVTDYSVHVNMETPTDGLFDMRDGISELLPVVIEVSHV